MSKLSKKERAAAVKASKAAKNQLLEYVQKLGTDGGVSMFIGNSGGFCVAFNDEPWEQLFIDAAAGGFPGNPFGFLMSEGGPHNEG